jgi:hypothetical protein
MVPFLLFLHIATAIIAFGPSYMIPLTARMAAQEPEHRGFVARMNLMVASRVTLPLALTMALTGGLMVVVGHIPVTLWLQLGILLYLGLLAYSWFVQIPLTRRIVDEMSKARGAPSTPSATAPAAAPGATPVGPTPRAAAGVPAGPPPELMAMVKRARLGGTAMGVVTLIIVALMVWKPTL